MDSGLVGLGRLTLRQAQSSPCMSCGTSPCCVYLPLHSFEVRTLRDLEHAIYLLNFDRMMLGLSPAGEWSVYYRHPCRFLDRSKPNNYLCTIHDMPLQPRICANYNPYACWYRRALGSGKSDIFLQIDRARMERISEGLAFDEHRVIVETPDWPALLEIAATLPIEPLNDGALEPDPMFDLWLEKVAAGSSFATGPVRRAYQDFLDPCDGCAAHCCKTLVFPLARPATRRSVDYIQFALGFPGIEVGISDGEWSLNVRTSCRHLTADNRCGVFGQPERPSLCRYYDATSCSYVTQFGDPRPRGYLRVRLEQFFWLVDAMVFDADGSVARLPPTDQLREVIEARWREAVDRAAADAIAPSEAMPLETAPPPDPVPDHQGTSHA